ncbi:MAG: site-specific integrase [Pseudomonadota bacterium]
MHKNVASNDSPVAPDSVPLKISGPKLQELEEPNGPNPPKPRHVLTDRGLKALKPAKPGRRDMHWDAALPSFGVRVTDRGSASFIVMRRLHGKVLRRVIGYPWHVPLPAGADLPYPLMRAREEAREALRDMEGGVDPKAKREAKVREAKRQAENSFKSVAERFIADHVERKEHGKTVMRSSHEVAAAIRRELIPLWGKTPIVGITRADVVGMLRAVAKERPYIAHHLHSYTRKLFNWALSTEEYGLETSPCDRISAKAVIGAKKPRQHILSDKELAEIWRATANDSGFGFPFAPFVRLLLLTGQRLREVADATWAEFDLDKALWTIPAERMKGDAAHEVPLSPAAVELLGKLPRFEPTRKSKGTAEALYLFSTTSGERPISGFSRAKTRLDGMMSEVGEWRYHDLRRTVRTHLGGLPVPSNVAELVIAHAQPGLHKVYDLHAYRDEKRRALELWADRLLSIVGEAPGGNVLPIRRRQS